MSYIMGNGFQKVYQAYLHWFGERCIEELPPKSEEELIACQSFQEEVFMNEKYILSRMYFSAPLLPSESKNSILEFFVFSELNFMERDPGDDIRDILPVEYRVEPFFR